MIGYHFTTWDNWQKIQNEGLKPYFLPEHLHRQCEQELYAIFVWEQQFSGVNLACQLMDRAISHHSMRIMLLRVEFGRRDIFKREWEFKHTGSLHVSTSSKGELRYHKDEPFLLITNPIPPERIEVVGDFDFLTMVRDGMDLSQSAITDLELQSQEVNLC